MARERKSIKSAALAFPPCYLFTGLVSFPVDFFFLVLTGCFIAQIHPLHPKKEDLRCIFKCKIGHKEEGPCNQKDSSVQGVSGGF